MRIVFRIIVVFVFLLPLVAVAQQEKGIQFDKSMSWNELLEKATRENKYIFMDVMATWCGPCRSMASAVFTNEEVGKFMNDHFINVKLQVDETTQDNDYVKAWHKEVDVIHKRFNIKTMPTLLFFNPKGEIVHIIPGATTNIRAFLDLAKDVLDESKQLYTRLRKYDAGERDVEFLYDLSIDLVMNGDKVNAMRVANTFWLTITPEERLLKKGIQYAGDFISSTKDETFKFFLDHPKEVDAVLGQGVADQKVLMLIDREWLFPHLKDSVNMPDWNGLYQDLCTRFPQRKKDFPSLIAERKVGYAERFHKDDLYLAALLELVPLEGEKGNRISTRSYAHKLGLSARNQEQRNIALQWLKAMLGEKDPVGTARYAEILFLSGKKKEGKKYLEQAMETMKVGGVVYMDVTRIKEKYGK